MRRAAPIWMAVVLGGCGPTLVWYGHDRVRAVELRVEESFGQQWLTAGNEPGPRFDAVGLEGIAIASDGAHVAYPALVGHRWSVVADGVRGKPWDGIAEIGWSERGGVLIYAGMRRGRWHVVHDGRVGPAFDGVQRGSLTQSADGRRSAYVASRGLATWVVVDGGGYGPYDAAGTPMWTARGEHTAWIAEQGAHAFVVLDGHPGPLFDAVADLTLRNDGRGFVHAARTEQGAFVIRDGVPGARHDAIVPGSLRLSPRDRHLGYLARDRGATYVVLDGRGSRAYDSATPPVFDATDEHSGYLGRRHGMSFVVVDGLVHVAAARVESLAVAEAGRFAYVTERGGRAVVVHPGGQSSFDLVVADTLVLSDDGMHWACIAGDRASRRLDVVVDGAAAAPFDLEELAAHQMADAAREGGAALDDLTDWVRAEMALAPH